jgi:hypothetical protein
MLKQLRLNWVDTKQYKHQDKDLHIGNTFF